MNAIIKFINDGRTAHEETLRLAITTQSETMKQTVQDLGRTIELQATQLRDMFIMTQNASIAREERLLNLLQPTAPKKRWYQQQK